LSATGELRADHDQVRRLQKVIEKCAEKIANGSNIPFSDLEKITIVIYEFVDTIFKITILTAISVIQKIVFVKNIHP